MLHVQRAAYLRMIEPRERDAEIVRNSLFGNGSSVNLNTLIEIACSRPSSELQCIKQAYRSRYNSDLEQDVTTKINSGFKEVITINYQGKYLLHVSVYRHIGVPSLKSSNDSKSCLQLMISIVCTPVCTYILMYNNHRSITNCPKN